MTTKSTPEWYNVIDIFEISDLSVQCPRCAQLHPVDVMFDEEFRKCLHCQITLVEWSLYRYIYLIDFEKSPDIVKHLASYVRQLPADIALRQLSELSELLGRDLDGVPEEAD